MNCFFLIDEQHIRYVHGSSLLFQVEQVELEQLNLFSWSWRLFTSHPRGLFSSELISRQYHPPHKQFHRLFMCISNCNWMKQQSLLMSHPFSHAYLQLKQCKQSRGRLTQVQSLPKRTGRLLDLCLTTTYFQYQGTPISRKRSKGRLFSLLGALLLTTGLGTCIFPCLKSKPMRLNGLQVTSTL